jgi:putative intracellular protease/amidase
MSKKVLIITADPAISTTTGWPVGFWTSEVTHPYHILTQAHVAVTIASPKGGRLEMDAMSDPFHESGYSAWDEISKQYLQDKDFRALLENAPAISDLQWQDYAAIIVAGGQAPMFTFEQDAVLQKLFVDFYESGKVTAALCHGTAILCFARHSDGKLLAEGRQVTGFANEEEDDADAAAGTQVMPWRIEDALHRLGAQYSKGPKWEPYVVADANLITGQQNMSGEALARMVLEKLGIQTEKLSIDI